MKFGFTSGGHIAQVEEVDGLGDCICSNIGDGDDDKEATGDGKGLASYSKLSAPSALMATGEGIRKPGGSASGFCGLL